jgi:hypothetical protein
MRRNGTRCSEFVIEPDDVILFGNVTLIADSRKSLALRGYLRHILGWADDRAVTVDNAARTIRLSSSFRTALVICGELDMVPIAHALHRRTLGPDRPFVVGDRRRRETEEAPERSPTNRGNATDALRAARGGSVCVRARRLPPDFTSILGLVGEPNVNVQLIVCADDRHAEVPLLAAAAPIQVPSLRGRQDDLPRIVDEYGYDAAAALGVDKLCFTVTDRQWVIDNGAASLSVIEKATMRLLALKTANSLSQAAERLGMAPVTLSRWAHRRTPPSLPPP